MYCPVLGKTQYATAHAAHTAAAKIRQNRARNDQAFAHKASRAGSPKLGTQAFRCPHCEKWHLGLKSER